jgi:hypothetical protein
LAIILKSRRNESIALFLLKIKYTAMSTKGYNLRCFIILCIMLVFSCADVYNCMFSDGHNFKEINIDKKVKYNFKKSNDIQNSRINLHVFAIND